jgi:hypothetical protein
MDAHVLDNLEAEYNTIPKWNCNQSPYIFSTTGWSLDPYTWNRFLNWLKPLYTAGILSLPSKKESQLAFPLVFSDLNANIPNIMDEAIKLLAGLRIIFRGFDITETGLILRGFPQNDKYYRKLLLARFLLSPKKYHTNCYITLFTWTRKLMQTEYEYIYGGIKQWSECKFGYISPYKWESLTGITHHLPKEISHRGLINGPNTLENNPQHLEMLIQNGLTCECDIWIKDSNIWLGHDKPEHSVEWDFLIKNGEYLLIHAKDIQTFHALKMKADTEGVYFNIFYHTDEDMVLTSQGTIIIHPGNPVLDGTLSMMPEWNPQISLEDAGFVCSDYISV